MALLDRGMSSLRGALVTSLFLIAALPGCGGPEVPPPKEPPQPTLDAPNPEPNEKALWATIVVESAPQGLQVLLAGKPVGKTPVTIDKLKAGSHSVTIKDEANGDVTQTIDVEEGGYKLWKYNVPPRADRPPPANARQ
jgi:hypothetical protein